MEATDQPNPEQLAAWREENRRRAVERGRVIEILNGARRDTRDALARCAYEVAMLLSGAGNVANIDKYVAEIRFAQETARTLERVTCDPHCLPGEDTARGLASLAFRVIHDGLLVLRRERDERLAARTFEA